MEPPTVDPSQAASGPERFNVIYASPESPTRLAIFREVYGPDYPEEVAPRSFITMPLLRRLAQGLAVGPGRRSLTSAVGAPGPASGWRVRLGRRWSGWISPAWGSPRRRGEPSS
jgi:hypothetical protein